MIFKLKTCSRLGQSELQLCPFREGTLLNSLFESDRFPHAKLGVSESYIFK
jgi:hypothetical protein